MKYEILNSKKELTIDEQEFLALHNKAYQAALFSVMYGYEFGKILKEMLDSKKYLAAGYETLEEYTMDVFNLKKSQAYKYINICETYSEEFFHSSGNLGITKLNLLSSIGEESEIKEFIEENNVNDLTVKELEGKIKDLKDSLKEKDNKIKELKIEVKEAQAIIPDSSVDDSKIVELNKEIDSLRNELKSKDNSNKLLNDEIESLNKKLSLSNNEAFNEFKVVFNNLQVTIQNVLKLVEKFEDNTFKNKCYSALNTLFKGSVTND